MKVSIITVCFNSDKTIEDTLKSIQSQTYSDIEYIVIDGNSKDSTNEIVSQYNDIVTVHISETDKGLYDAMNKGIRLATGDVIGILNSDDVFASKNSLSQLMSGFNSGKVDAVYSDLVHVSEFNLNKVTRLYSSKVFSRFLIRFGFMLPHPTFYVKRSIYEEFGLYEINYRAAADFELITRFVSNNITLKRVPAITIKMREGGVSSSGFKGRVQQTFEIVRACKENDIYTNIFFVMLKVPYKVLTLFTRWFIRVDK
jgi:glycosyltransferase involved in cell wall biosynthesis